jgi:hypothetical protein
VNKSVSHYSYCFSVGHLTVASVTDSSIQLLDNREMCIEKYVGGPVVVFLRHYFGIFLEGIRKTARINGFTRTCCLHRQEFYPEL